MKSILRNTFIVMGTVFFLFIINIMLFCFVPSYRDMLVKAVGHNEEIYSGKADGIVTVEDSNISNMLDKDVYTDANNNEAKVEETAESIDEAYSEYLEKKQLENETSVDMPEEPALDSVDIRQQMGNADSIEEQQKLQIIDKEYHEDCGTGKGYWVITYSDGSTSVE